MKSNHIGTLVLSEQQIQERLDIPVTQYFAYEMVNDDMLIGYGLPRKDSLRNNPYISTLVK